jgi:hypothetical protein
MSVSINPATFASRQLFNPKTGKADPAAVSQFLNDLSQWAGQIQANLSAPLYLSGLLNGSNALVSSAFNHINVTSISGSTDCTGALIITAGLLISAASTMTLNNVADGSLIDLRIVNGSGLAQTLKVAANKPGGGAYSVLVISGGVVGAEVDMTATGFSVPNGNAIYLRGIAQLTVGVIALGYV